MKSLKTQLFMKSLKTQLFEKLHLNKELLNCQRDYDKLYGEHQIINQKNIFDIIYHGQPHINDVDKIINKYFGKNDEFILINPDNHNVNQDFIDAVLYPQNVKTLDNIFDDELSTELSVQSMKKEPWNNIIYCIIERFNSRGYVKAQIVIKENT